MLNKVELSSDVALVCMQHALSTEKEEIMGLLIGEVHNNDTLVSIVSSVILRRLDKKPDRVEISEEQLVQATMKAEQLASELGRPLRVVGWYHSHPHITVWPSHVDLATQFMYQRMDASFVGIIFAVFLTDQTSKAPSLWLSNLVQKMVDMKESIMNGVDFIHRAIKVQITCFQSVNEGSTQSRKEIEMEIIYKSDSLVTNNFETLTQLPAILKEEEDEAFNNEACQSDIDDIINRQHNSAVRTIAIGHIVDKMSRPMLEALVARNTLNNVRLKALKIQHKQLMAKYEEITSCNMN